MDKAHLTAIARNKLSRPAKWLIEHNMLCGDVLDYGCGRGYDATLCNFAKYDPYYSPDMPVGRFDYIMCNYVLNVIPDEDERESVINDIRGRLLPGGIAYVSVRNDKKNLNGYTSKGTWQGLIELDLPVVTSNANFTMYKLEN